MMSSRDFLYEADMVYHPFDHARGVVMLWGRPRGWGVYRAWPTRRVGGGLVALWPK
jgi:hypothetical protein